MERSLGDTHQARRFLCNESIVPRSSPAYCQQLTSYN